jgi:DNA polymerase-3 subunit delta'
MLAEVQGQEEGVRFLRRVVEGKLTSPLLFVGDEGTGRRFSVVQAIKELFCSGTREKGCPCVDCHQLDQSMHPDFTSLSVPDDKDIGVDAIREIVANADNAPLMAPLRCVLIDGVDRMTIPAANALLKTLEEPPQSLRFFLLAESDDRILPTIRSRTGKVSYRSLPEDFVLSVLQRHEHDHAKALVYARMSEGSIGRAIRYWGAGRLGLRDRVVSLLQLALGGDVAGFFPSIDGFSQDLPLALRFLEQLLHDILMVAYVPDRLIHQDLSEGLAKLAGSRTFKVWSKFAVGLKAVRDRHRMTRINLSFHVKTLFAQTFAGV